MLWTTPPLYISLLKKATAMTIDPLVIVSGSMLLSAVRASRRHKLFPPLWYSGEKHARKSDSRFLACAYGPKGQTPACWIKGTAL
jgi:hypothetical protein